MYCLLTSVQPSHWTTGTRLFLILDICTHTQMQALITAACIGRVCAAPSGTQYGELCATRRHCVDLSSMVITLSYAQRSLPATHHPSHISPHCSSRGFLGLLSTDRLKPLSSPNSQRHHSFISSLPSLRSHCTAAPQLKGHRNSQ